MGETIIVILTIVLVTSMMNMEVMAKDTGKRSGHRHDATDGFGCMDCGQPENCESKTIDLIGEKAYQEMNNRVERILREHGRQSCLAVSLTSGPTSQEASRELHSLLPGEPVLLSLSLEKGVKWVDVYSRGQRIGRLALNEAEIIFDTMRQNHLRAAFVAEQNCYGIEDSHNLRIIVFYEPRLHDDEIPTASVCEHATTDFCQN